MAPTRKVIKRRLPNIHMLCDACGDTIELRDVLRLGDAHPDICSARPVLLRLDSDSSGNWVPIIQSHESLTEPDRERIRAQIEEMVADYKSRS